MLIQPRRLSASALLSCGSVLLLILAAASGILLHGCREQSSAPIDRNQPPETVLVGVPGDSTTSFYRIALHWMGSDSDGRVAGYEWAITDSLPGADNIRYQYTTKTDSTFVFTVEETRQVLGHRFYVRAVDNEGKVDETPAYTFFTVRDNCIPTAWFTRAIKIPPADWVPPPGWADSMFVLRSTNLTAPTDTVPTGWSVAFDWRGTDCDVQPFPDGQPDTVGTVQGYVYRLSPLELVEASGGVSDTTRLYPAAQFRSGLYVMSVRARDDAGMMGARPAVRSFVWNKDPETYFATPEGEIRNVFYAREWSASPGPFQAYTEGDTLPLRAGGLEILANFRGRDPDPAGLTGGIQAIEARLIVYSGFWSRLEMGPDPLRLAAFTPSQRYYMGDYNLMARAMDEQSRWDGSPANIRFSIDREPVWRTSWTYDDSSHVQRPAQGEVIHQPVGTELTLRFAVLDPDSSDLSNPIRDGIEFTYKFDRYPRLNGEGSESFFRPNFKLGAPYPDPDPAPVYYYREQARLPDGSVFLPGEYVLSVKARERPTEERFGSREVMVPPVHFTIAAD